MLREYNRGTQQGLSLDPSCRSISFHWLAPTPPKKRDSDRGRWGSMIAGTTGSKSYRCRTSTPVNDVDLNGSRHSPRKLSLQDLYPPLPLRGGRGSGTATEDDGGIELTRSASRSAVPFVTAVLADIPDRQ